MRYDQDIEKSELQNEMIKNERFNEIENDLLQAKQRCNKALELIQSLEKQNKKEIEEIDKELQQMSYDSNDSLIIE